MKFCFGNLSEDQGDAHQYCLTFPTGMRTASSHPTYGTNVMVPLKSSLVNYWVIGELVRAWLKVTYRIGGSPKRKMSWEAHSRMSDNSHWLHPWSSLLNFQAAPSKNSHLSSIVYCFYNLGEKALWTALVFWVSWVLGPSTSLWWKKLYNTGAWDLISEQLVMRARSCASGSVINRMINTHKALPPDAKSIELDFQD